MLSMLTTAHVSFGQVLLLLADNIVLKVGVVL